MLRFYTMRQLPAKQPSHMQNAGHGSAAVARAWLVHAYTATGAVLAFVGAWAVVHGNDRLALAAMFAATIVDATDGVLARARAGEGRAARTSTAGGSTISSTTSHSCSCRCCCSKPPGGLPGWAALPVIAVVLLSSMYGFVAPDAKTADHFFTGFPSYWNIVVLYLLLFRVPPLCNACILLALSALVFVRIGCVYPSRTPTLRGLTLGLGVAWAVLVAGDHLAVAVGAAMDRDRVARCFPSITPCSHSCFTPAGRRGDVPVETTGSRSRAGLYALPRRLHGHRRGLVDAAGMGGLQAAPGRRRHVVLCRGRARVVPDGRAAARRVARSDSRRPAERGRRRRRSPLLHALRHRSDRARPRRLSRRPARRAARRRQHAHAAARAHAVPVEQEDAGAQGAGSGARAAARAGAVEEADPRAVSQSHLPEREASTASRRCRGICTASRRSS